MTDPIPDFPSSLRLEPGADFHPAPLLVRTIAYVMDLVASVIITLALYQFIGQALLRAFGGNPFIAQVLGNSMYFIGGLGYWVFLPLGTGATPAKMLFHMRIVPESEKPLSPIQVLLREIIGHAATVLTLGLGFLIASRDPRLRGLNDRLAGTRLIQFTSPHPELYRVQDLCTVDKEGTLQSKSVQVAEVLVAEPADSAEIQAQPEAPPAAAPQEPVSRTEPEKSSLYTRPTGETAHERKIRAAMGPTIEELAAALRRTAEMVTEGQLTQKALDRKREDFIDKVRTADLGDAPTDAISIIVELGKEGILTRSELEEVRDILRKRLSG